MGDLLAATAALIDILSPSHGEAALADRVEAELTETGHLTVTRLADNVVARTELGRPQRLVLAGHLDTVPPAGNERAVIDGDTVRGLGAADMKGGLAVMLELARTEAEPAVDVTYVFYAAEETAAVHNGLKFLFENRPDLVAGDAAILGEPTGAAIEAGCQGTARFDIALTGARAHTARPWMGVNAIHRLGRLLDRIDNYEPRQPVIDGCRYREAVQATAVSGGIAGNVVPDEARLTVNLRFAPDRDVDAALAAFMDLAGDAIGHGDRVEMTDHSPAAPPALTHPLFAPLLAGREVRAKLGWTDVARFAAAGIPAVNFGPGESTLAHTPGESVDRSALEGTAEALRSLLRGEG